MSDRISFMAFLGFPPVTWLIVLRIMLLNINIAVIGMVKYIVVSIIALLLLSMLANGYSDYDEYEKWMEKGEDYYNSGSLELALMSFDKALEYECKSGSWCGEKHANALGWKGVVLDGLNRYNEAVKAYDSALSYKNWAWLWKGKGNALMGLKRYGEALTAYENAIKIDPIYEDAWIGKGYALIDMGRYEDAIHAFDLLLDINPNYNSVWSSKAYAYKLWGKNESALEAYDKQIQIDPENWFYQSKAEFQVSMGKYEDAIVTMDEAIGFDPSSYDNWIVKGNILSMQAKYDQAISAYEEGIKLNVKCNRCWHGKGLAFYNLTRYNESIESYDKEIEILKPRLNSSSEGTIKAAENLIAAALAARELSVSALNMQLPIISQDGKIVPISEISSANASADENNLVTILGIDAMAFPEIKVSVLIGKSCALAGNLSKGDFSIEENGTEVAIGDVYFTGDAAGQQLDLAIVFDDTDSMGGEIEDMQSKVEELIKEIKSSNLNARYSLVSFKDEVLTKIEWTSDADAFKLAVDKLSASGGNFNRPEDSLGGIERILSFGFRPDAQKIVIVVTDEPSAQEGDGWSGSPYTLQEVRADLMDSGAMLVAISPDFSDPNVDPGVPISDMTKYADMRNLAEETSGLWIDINSADFSVILDQFQKILTGTYVIEYTSPEQTQPDTIAVQVSMNAPECVTGNVLGFSAKDKMASALASDGGHAQ